MAKITAKKVKFPTSTWVHAVILTCDDKLAVWFKNHKGIPTVCCLYPKVDGPSYYAAMSAWPGPGKFVWWVLPYRQPYTLVQPPTPPWGCTDDSCLLFLNGNQTLTAAADNAIEVGSIDFQCNLWPLNLPGFDIPATPPSPLSIGMQAIIESPYPATVDMGYSLNNGPITHQTVTLDANPDGSGSANFQFFPVTTNPSDTIQLFLRPPSNCTLRGTAGGQTSVVHVFHP